MVAGVTIPTVAIVILIVLPYVDRNPSTKPGDRKLAIVLFTMFLMFWGILTIIGSFFRGPGFNFIMPWTDGIFFEL
jgi:menaquinol-cytochrome c reductase cytochrome b/c subunit